MPTIHVHSADGREVAVFTRKHAARRTTDAGSLRSLYDELSTRMALCLRDTLATRTHDDEHGHAFHGNQHTGGISGPHKPKHEHVAHVQAQGIKSAKAKVHALLVSGHPFSKDELAIAVGIDPQGKTIKDYLTNLKSPKWAGPQGALNIEKNKDGMYFVALPNGQPAPPPDVKVDWGKVNTPAAPKLEDWGYGNPPAPPPEVPVNVPADVPTQEMQTALDIMKSAHPGSMPKAEADKHYEAAVDGAYWSMAAWPDAHTAAMHFKNEKAKAMAAWAQAVHGHPFTVKQQQVFKADTQLVADAKTLTKEEALGNWKKNTAAEKAGNFPPKTVAAKTVVKPTTQATPAVVTDMGDPAPVSAIDYASTRPKGHMDIDEDDIMSGKFRTGILKLKRQLKEASAESASKNKNHVEEKLRARLFDKPNFQALVKRLGLSKTGQGSLESRLIGTWAGSSGDSNDLSVAMQLAVRDAFGIPDEHIEKKALHSLQKYPEDKVIAVGITSLNNNIDPLKPSEIPVVKAALREFVQAQYEETQEHLKSLGHDHVFLARGMKTSVAHDYTGPSALKLQPASSFSADYHTARAFGGSGGTVFVTKVPRQQVLSSYMTGFGCTGEHEVVVLAHDKMKAYTLPASSTVADNATYASSYLQQKLKEHHPELKVSNHVETEKDLY